MVAVKKGYALASATVGCTDAGDGGGACADDDDSEEEWYADDDGFPC